MCIGHPGLEDRAPGRLVDLVDIRGACLAQLLPCDIRSVIRETRDYSKQTGSSQTKAIGNPRQRSATKIKNSVDNFRFKGRISVQSARSRTSFPQ